MSRLENTIEQLIDANDLPTVLDALSTVCGAKQEHLAANWQDNVSAKYWTKFAVKLDKLAALAK